MNDFGFINGSEVTVKVDGNAVGGIISAVCKAENNLIKIEEFLTDKPVHFSADPSYSIELKTHIDPDRLFDGGFDKISFESADSAVDYSGCKISRVESIIKPRGITQYSVVISASDRSVENE